MTNCCQMLQALLSRHNRLDIDIRAFNTEIKRLDELAMLMTKAASEHNVRGLRESRAP